MVTFEFRKLGVQQIADFFRLLVQYRATFDVQDSHPMYGSNGARVSASWPDYYGGGNITFPNDDWADAFLQAARTCKLSIDFQKTK